MTLTPDVVEEGARYARLWALDYAVVALFFAAILLMGWLIGRRHQNIEEYFVAGRRMSWFAVGLSLMATLTSTISYLSSPGELIKHGVMAVIGGIFAFPAVYLVIAFLVIPFLMGLKVTSVYEYLEKRFDLATRMFAASLFLLIRMTWMALIVYTASGALAQITDLDRIVIVVGVGVVAVVYTALGGMRAVIWTDVIQSLILFAGAVCTVWYVAATTGTGPIAWWQDLSASRMDRPAQPFFSADPFARVSLVGSCIWLFSWYLCTNLSDQVAIQRYLSVASVKMARRSLACDLLAGTLSGVLLCLCGMALYSYYAPELPTEADDVFPYFIRSQLPRGLAGLVVAALFSAAMSSLDSGMNSIATVLTVDFWRRFRKTRYSESQEIVFAKLVTVVVGSLAVGLCILLLWIPENRRGNLLELAQRLNSFIIGPLGGLFLAAIFIRRCRGSTVIMGSVLGMVVGFVFALGHWFFYDPLPYLTVRGGPELVGENWLLSRDSENAIVLPEAPGDGHQFALGSTQDGWQIRVADSQVPAVPGSPKSRTSLLKPNESFRVGPYKLAVELRTLSWMWGIPVSCVITFLATASLTWVSGRLRF